MGVGREPPVSVFVHDTCEVFNSHLGGSVSHGGVDLGLLLLGVFNSFGGKVWEEAYGLSHSFI